MIRIRCSDELVFITHEAYMKMMDEPKLNVFGEIPNIEIIKYTLSHTHQIPV